MILINILYLEPKTMNCHLNYKGEREKSVSKSYQLLVCYGREGRGEGRRDCCKI